MPDILSKKVKNIAVIIIGIVVVLGLIMIVRGVNNQTEKGNMKKAQQTDNTQIENQGHTQNSDVQAEQSTQLTTATPVTLANPPVLTAAAANTTVGQGVSLTFYDDPAWRTAIADVTVNGNSIAGQYSASAGTITINAGVFTAVRDYAIVVKAGGYQNAAVTQSIKGMAKTILIDGMMCDMCVKHVKDALSALEGVQIVEVVIGRAVVTLNKEVSDAVLKASVENAGYTVIQ